MKEITALQIKAWINSGERFEGKAVGKGLYLVYRKDMAKPFWRFRYRFNGKQRAMFIGDYTTMSLKQARDESERLLARVKLGEDVAATKQTNKKQAIKALEDEKNRLTVSMLADQFYEQKVLPKAARPENSHSAIKRLKQYIGKMYVEDVTAKRINIMFQDDLKRGYPTSTNRLREYSLRIFGFAVAQGLIKHNPVEWLDISYAGGSRDERERNLSYQEIQQLFDEMRNAKGFGRRNYLTVKLLLILCVRKGELQKAKKSEFDLDAGVWFLNKNRTKTNSGIDIPLPSQAVESLRELFVFSCESEYLLPARRIRKSGAGHISDNTLNNVLEKITGLDHFTVHDLRRTAKSRMQENGVEEFISERCLNHKIKGVSSRYGRHDFFDARKEALQAWANYLEACEKGKDWNVTPIRRANNG